MRFSHCFRLICVLSFFLNFLVLASVHAENCRIQSLSKNKTGSIVDLKGTFASRFEFSGFKECYKQKNSWWWLDAPKHYGILMEELKKAPGTPGQQKLYIHVKACLSQPGNYGHMAAYPFQLEVIELYNFSATIPEECSDKVEQR